jgi:UDP-N-acetyl-D-glucosamine/UDP-N-acetyl-D-galactosamine dehydrogenase
LGKKTEGGEKLMNGRNDDQGQEFKSFNCHVDVYDPWVDKEEAQHEYDITPIDTPTEGKYDAIILAVSHNEFQEMGADAIRQLGRENHVLYDIKYILNADEVDGRL